MPLRKPPKPTIAWASAVFPKVCHSTPPRPIRLIRPSAMMPFGANGDSVPASTPWPAMIAMRSGGTPAWPAMAIAGGASRALAGVAPAPMVERMRPSAKNMIGRTPACPRHSRTARAVSRASVPLHSAMLKSSVTPTSVMNSETGNPMSTASADIPPRNTPTTSARASDSTPTLIVVVRLRVTATTSAPTEIHARLIAPRRCRTSLVRSARSACARVR